MIAPGSSRYSSNDMVHNHYLEEAKKKTQESGRNSRPSVMPSARSQSTSNGSNPTPSINNQKSRNWPASKSSCVTTKTVPTQNTSRNSRILNEVNSRAKVPSNKTTKRYIPVEQTSFAKNQKDKSQKDTGLQSKRLPRDHEKTMTPRSCLVHDHSNELCKFKLVPKVVSPADKTATSRQELELLFHHHITMMRSYALSWKPCQGDSLNLPDHRIHKDGDGDASFQLKSDSLPHAHAQTTKTYYKHQDSRIMKAQELKTKTSAQTLIYKIFLQRYQVYQGRLLASFQDDAKYEHVGQDTRSQGGKDDQDGRIKI
ncbi:hypothetical protein Tco_0630010 [Tanacetum coccineum]